MKLPTIRPRSLIITGLFFLALLLPFIQTPISLAAEKGAFDGADGPYQYETLDDITLIDQARNREIPLRIYYPKSPGLISPVLLVSHGIGGSKATGNWVGKFMTSHGYVCVFMTHYGSDSSLLDLSTGMEENIKRLQKSLIDPMNTINRPQDVSKVIDWLEQTGINHPVLKGRMDLKNIGLTGHSFGAFTTLASAGGYAEASRKQYGKTYSDPRPKAFLAMSPPGPPAGADPTPIFNEIGRPTLIMTGSNDLDPIVKPPRSAESRMDAYKYMPPGDKYALWIEGAYHHTFGDRRPGLSIDPFAREISRIVLLAFFDAYLKGSETAKVFLKSDQIEKSGEGKIKFFKKDKFSKKGEGTMVQIVDETTLKNGFKEVEGIKWHWVEAGQGQPVVLVHGLPESWYAWRYQIPSLAAHFRVIVPDLKGYGQSDKGEGNYSAANVARELAGLIQSLGYNKYYLVGHDWGGVVASQLAAAFPERIIKYIHMSTPIHIYDPKLVPHHKAFQDMEKTTALMSNADPFIRAVYASSCKKGAEALTEAEMKRIIEEFARPGTAAAVPRYFRDTPIGSPSISPHWERLTMPVYLIYPDSDPRQPLYFLDGVEKIIPGYKGKIIIHDSGHFSMQEQPDQVNKALLDFLLD